MRIAIVGGGPAGFAAALAIAEEHSTVPSSEIALFAESSQIGFCLGTLPLFFSKILTIDHVKTKRDILLKEKGVKVHVNTRVNTIDFEHNHIVYNNSSVFQYDKLIIAVGAGKRKKSNIKGISKSNVIELSSYEDGVKLQPLLESARNVLIIGTGFVGIEVCCISSSVFDTVIIDSLPITRIPGWITDSDIEEAFREKLTKAGATLKLGINLEEIEILDREVRILGEKIPADIIVDALGGEKIDPLGFIRASKLEFGSTKLIKVNSKMETNIKDVYAAGNCCEYVDFLNQATPSLGEAGAWIQGKHAGLNALGANYEVKPLVMPGVLLADNFEFGYVGYCSTDSAIKKGFDVISADINSFSKMECHPEARPLFLRLFADRKSRRILGAVLLGEQGVKERVNILEMALRKNAVIDDIEDYESAFLPNANSVPDPLSLAAEALRKKAQI